MPNFFLSIITPKGKVYEGETESLIAPGSEGSFGVLKGHTPIVAQLKEGALTLSKGAEKTKFKTAAGVLEVSQKGDVLVLVNSAERSD